MAKLLWDVVGEHDYVYGVNKCVLYTKDATGAMTGVAWSGITTASATPSGAEDTKYYADNIPYFTITSQEELGGTIGAYSYPPQWDECNGVYKDATGVRIGSQPRKRFGICWTNTIGDDLTGNKTEELVIIFNAAAAPADRATPTKNDSPAPVEFSWTLTTLPVPYAGGNPTPVMYVKLSDLTDAARTTLLDTLYGTATTEPTLPTPDEIIQLLTPTPAP